MQNRLQCQDLKSVTSHKSKYRVSHKSVLTLFFTIFSDKIQEICDMIGTRILKIDSENFHFRN